MKRVLITTTSLQDTPGGHQDMLKQSGWEIETARGPLSEEQILELVGEFDGIICGDDLISRKVLEKALPRLQFLSKYGIGVDKIDVEAATDLGIPLLFTPGVNHTTVSEHVFVLMLSLHRQFYELLAATKSGHWKRLTGHPIGIRSWSSRDVVLATFRRAPMLKLPAIFSASRARSCMVNPALLYRSGAAPPQNEHTRICWTKSESC